MPPDPAKIAEVRGWLQKALDDLQAAETLLRADPSQTSATVFHCQQAAEKTLKAFLAWHGTPFRKTHSLEELGEQCLKIDSTLKAVVDAAVPLTEYAWRFRYPGEPREPSAQEAEGALATARQVYEAAVSRVPKNAAPR